MKRQDLDRSDPQDPSPQSGQGGKPPGQTAHPAKSLISWFLACGSLAATIAVIGASFLAARMDSAPPGAFHAAAAMSMVFMGVFLLTLKVIGIKFEALMGLLWRQPLIAGAVILYGAFSAMGSAPELAQNMKTSYELNSEAHKLDQDADLLKKGAASAPISTSIPDQPLEAASVPLQASSQEQEDPAAAHDTESSIDTEPASRIRHSIRDREGRDRETRDR